MRRGGPQVAEAGSAPVGTVWFYVLKEAEAYTGGEDLGPVGATIVGEVLVGIIDRDPESYRAVDPGWRPTLPPRQPGRFSIADALVPID